jgi:hypothetical protein
VTVQLHASLFFSTSTGTCSDSTLTPPFYPPPLPGTKSSDGQSCQTNTMSTGTRTEGLFGECCGAAHVLVCHTSQQGYSSVLVGVHT